MLMETVVMKRRDKPEPPADDSAWDASRLRALWSREKRDPTQIAASIGVTPETLRQWRRGAYEPPATTLRALARQLGADLLDVLPPE